MTLKQLIDQIYRASNGGLQRSEILRLIDQAQAKLYSANCVELLSRSTISVSDTTTYPTARTITWDADPRKTLDISTSYTPGDILMAPGTPGAWLVDSPFSTDGSISATERATILQDYCTVIPYQWATAYDPSTYPHEGVTALDGQAIATGAFVWYPDIEQWWLCTAGYTVDEDTLEADRLANAIPLVTDPIVDGETTQATTTNATVTATGFRAVTKVGTLDADGNWTTLEEVKIVQAKDRASSAVIYTTGLSDTGTYDIEGYLWPASISSETDDLFVPDSDRDGILMTMVMREIERENTGNSVYWEQLYQREWPQWLDRLNRDFARPSRPSVPTFNPLAG